jgi:hypothetical protein
MQGLKVFTDGVNDGIVTGILSKDTKFSGYKIFGIAELVTAEKQTFPSVFLKDGVYAGIDDRYPVIIYHRVNQVSISEPGFGYGNVRSNTMQAAFSMVMVVYLDKKVTCITSDEFLLLLLTSIPEGLNVEDFQDVKIKIGSAVLNQQAVFQNEYKGVQFFLKPESSLLSVSYTIEGRFKKGCFYYCVD